MYNLYLIVSHTLLNQYNLNSNSVTLFTELYYRITSITISIWHLTCLWCNPICCRRFSVVSKNTSTTRQGKQQTSAMHGKQQSSPWGWLRGLDGLFGAQPAKDQDNRENGLGVLFASSSSKSFMARCVCSDGGEQQQGGNTGGGATAISSRSPRSRASAYTAAHSRPPCRDQHTHSYERREIGQGLTYLCERAPSRREGETDLGAPVKVRNGR